MLDVSLHLIFLLLSHECLPHAIGDGAFIESLVSLDSHLDLVPHSDEQETSLSALDGYLTDQLVKALGVQFLSDGANTSLSGLSALQFLV